MASGWIWQRWTSIATVSEGVPRYNQFRRLIHKDPVKSFDELTDNAVWRQQIKKVYNNDLEKGGSDDGPLCRAAAPRLRVQRDRLPRTSC
jgi:hypothetical protein